MANIQDLKEQVEKRLQEQQSSKEFKDVGRVAQTRKEKSAFRLINSKMLVDLEDDAVMAYNMVKKENVWKEIDIQQGSYDNVYDEYRKIKKSLKIKALVIDK
jgi:hypothetical protein